MKENIDEIDTKQPKAIGKSIPAYGILKSQENICEPILPNVCDSKKSIPKGMVLKIYTKTLAKPIDFYSL
jgi:hypothetical protein